MTKSDLIKKIAEECEVTQSVAEKMLATTLGEITKSLTEGDTVAFVGFGTFSVKQRAARTGRNPQTGAVLAIPARKIPHFSVGKTLKDAVNK